MKCIDEDFELYGDFDTNIATNLMVVFDRCDPKERTCASDEDIDEWMKFKYMLLVENEENYMQSKPLGERMEQYARFSWNGLSGDNRSDKVRLVTFQDIHVMKSPIGITF